MDPDERNLLGVQKGRSPMLLVTPGFYASGVGQTFPLVSASNTITATLAGSVDFPENSTITLTGLTGTQTGDSSLLAVTSFPSNVFEGDAGEWNTTEGTLRLTLAAGGMQTGTEYTVTFAVQNGGDAQPGAIVAVSATLETGLAIDGPVAAFNLTADLGGLLSVPNGASPLLMVVPVFDVKDIGQSFPLVSASNVISVTLSGSVDFPGGSSITLTGLSGTQTADDVALDLGGNGSDSFGDAGPWTMAGGTLVLMVEAEGLSAGTNYTVSILVRNGAAAQGAVTVAVSGVVDSGEADDSPLFSVDMTSDAEDVGPETLNLKR
jgi:hypothetical protein